jgi:CRISPR/Cas system endoribonuclease Cas6 (RAMP superfamily)
LKKKQYGRTNKNIKFEGQIAKQTHIQEKIHYINQQVSSLLGCKSINHLTNNHASQKPLEHGLEENLGSDEHVVLSDSQKLWVSLTDFIHFDEKDPALKVYQFTPLIFHLFNSLLVLWNLSHGPPNFKASWRALQL